MIKERKKKYNVVVENFTDKTASGIIDNEKWTAKRMGIYGNWKIETSEHNKSSIASISRAIEKRIRAKVLATARGEEI